MKRNEEQTRKELIDPKLKSAGWEVLKDKHIIKKNKACVETEVFGMPKTYDKATGKGYIDYVLFGDDGMPLALIEAKKSVLNEEVGKVQACLYADCLEKQYGVRPVIYYTNGYTIKIIDGIYPAREVFGFHGKEELEHIIQKRKVQLVDKHVDANICGRYYQKDAIAEVIKHLETRHARSLIVLATGTGKTRTACGLSDIFIRNNYVKRILFLADRKNLVKQAKEETFSKFLPNIPMAIITDGNHEGADDARIVFSTYQSMLSLIKDTENCKFGIGHFDLIIVDEAHRSLFNKYGEIFDYFDSLMIGLTATPRDDIHKSTFKVFNLTTDMPNYEYDLKVAVKDGFLTYFRALDRTPVLLKDGLVYEQLSEEEKEDYEDRFTDENGEIPDKIEGSNFASIITNRDTIRAVLRDLMEEGLYVNYGNTLGKTIIFARDHNHAISIQEEFRLMYPELCIPDGKNGEDFCVVIDNKIKHNEYLQRKFKSGQNIRIVVSVDMMDTGVDIPEVVNLVFFKKVLSKIKFWQMIGRGTRLCQGLNIISPPEAYFKRLTNDNTRQLCKNKQGFLIFDACNVFSFFNENPDGRGDKAADVLSLDQKIFLEKVALYKSMQTKYASLDHEDRNLYTALRAELSGEVAALNRNSIGVQKNLKYVEYYSNINNWLTFLQPNFAEVKKYIAPNIISKMDVNSSMFDFQAFKFSSSKLIKNKDFAPSVKAINEIAKYLYKNKLSIDEVHKHESTLLYLLSNEFITDTTAAKMESIRLEIRDLIKYIEKDILEPIITDFNDKIDSTGDAPDEDVDFSISIDDFKTFEEKAFYYISTNKDKALINNIINLLPCDAAALEEIKREFKNIARDDAEYNDLFKNDNDIIIFIRRHLEFNPAAIENFLKQQELKGLNELQIEYIKQLLEFISQNGFFDRKILLREELDFSKYFDNIQIKELIEDIDEIM